MANNLRKKDAKWLDHIRSASSPGSGMYVGLQCDLVPDGASDRLYRAGYILTESPHNPVHKDRFVITPAGRAALQEAGR